MVSHMVSTCFIPTNINHLPTISQPSPNHLPAGLHLPDVLAARRFDGNGTRALPGQPGQIVPGDAPGD